MSSEFNSPTLPAMSWVSLLEDYQRELLASYGEFFKLEAGEILISDGEEQSHLHMVISGLLEARRSGLEHDHTLGAIRAGDCVGEIAIFDPGPASATVVAQEFSQIWRIDRDMLNTFLAENPEAGNYVLAGLATVLSQRVRWLNARLVERDQ